MPDGLPISLDGSFPAAAWRSAVQFGSAYRIAFDHLGRVRLGNGYVNTQLVRLARLHLARSLDFASVSGIYPSIVSSSAQRDRIVIVSRLFNTIPPFLVALRLYLYYIILPSLGE